MKREIGLEGRDTVCEAEEKRAAGLRKTYKLNAIRRLSFPQPHKPEKYKNGSN